MLDNMKSVKTKMCILLMPAILVALVLVTAIAAYNSFGDISKLSGTAMKQTIKAGGAQIHEQLMEMRTVTVNMAGDLEYDYKDETPEALGDDIVKVLDDKKLANGGGATGGFPFTDRFVISGSVGDHPVALLQFHQNIQSFQRVIHVRVEQNAVPVQQVADPQRCSGLLPPPHMPVTRSMNRYRNSPTAPSLHPQLVTSLAAARTSEGALATATAYPAFFIISRSL